MEIPAGLIKWWMIIIWAVPFEVLADQGRYNYTTQIREITLSPFTRVHRPNDKAHLERFNRTLQEECIDTRRPDVGIINAQLPEYLRWYNEKRHHFGLKLETPATIIRCSQGID